MLSVLNHPRIGFDPIGEAAQKPPKLVLFDHRRTLAEDGC